MLGLHRRLLLLGLSLGCSISLPVFAAGGLPTISASPGTLVRWSLPGTTHCAMKGRVWAALLEPCYYPIDLLQKPPVMSIARWGPGPREHARISREPADYGTMETELPDIPQA